MNEKMKEGESKVRNFDSNGGRMEEKKHAC
jgi:hypothetical protein